jgi:hypothetical protein
MMEAARTSETLVNFYQTTRPEDRHLRTHRRENLKSDFPYIINLESLNGRDDSEDLGVWKDNIKMDLRRMGGRLCIGFICLTIRTGGGLL